MISQPHQVATLEPVYRRVAIMEEYTRSLQGEYDLLSKNLEAGCLVLPAKIEDAPFHFIRRAWPQSDGARAFFNYSFFQNPSFEDSLFGCSAKSVWDELFEGNGFTPSFQKYLDWLEETRPISAVRLAAKWFRRQSQKSAPPDSKVLHHFLLMLYANTPIEGGIPGTLIEEFAEIEATVPPSSPFYVRTLSEPSEGAEDLPKLLVTRLPLDHQKSIEASTLMPQRSIRQGGDDEGLRSLFRRLDAWLLYGRPDSGAGGSRDREHLHMLWLPLYGFYSQRGEPCGMFLGWIFQLLGPPQNIELEGNHLTALAKYARVCRLLLPLLADGMYDQALREVSTEEVKEGDQVLDRLCDILHLFEGWKKPSVFDRTFSSSFPPGRVFWKENDRLLIDFRLTEYDNQRLWGLDGDLDAMDKPILALAPRSGEFRHPDESTSDACYGRIAARIREIYRQFSLTALRIEKERAIEAQTTRADLAATFAHSFSKVGEAISKGLEGSRTTSILKTVARAINEAPIPNEVRVFVQEELSKGVAQARIHPATRLYQDYFYPQVRSFYDKVQLMERLHGRTLQPKVGEAFSLKTDVEELFAKTVIPVAQQLPREGIRDTLRLFAEPDQLLVTSSLGGLFLVPASIKGSPDGTGKIDELLRDLWRNIFFELFLNALKWRAWCNLPAPTTARICMSWEPRRAGVARLTISNPVEPPDGPTGKWIEDWIKRPSAEYGLSGWGRFGIRLTLGTILRAGTVRFFRMRDTGGLGYGECHIDLEKPWWEQRS